MIVTRTPIITMYTSALSATLVSAKKDAETQMQADVVTNDQVAKYPVVAMYSDWELLAGKYTYYLTVVTAEFPGDHPC